MKKIAYGSGVVIVALTTNEFKVLAGKAYSDVADGTDVSLVSVKNKLDLVEARKGKLADLKQLSGDVVAKLTEIGI